MKPLEKQSFNKKSCELLPQKRQINAKIVLFYLCPYDPWRTSLFVKLELKTCSIKNFLFTVTHFLYKQPSC